MEDLTALIEYTNRGFCHKLHSMEEAERELGRKPILNRLGVVSGRQKKSRIIWDLKESGANLHCRQKERILLPRLLDLASQAIEVYRAGDQVWLAAVDIKDAFMNIPAGKDKFMTTAATSDKEGRPVILVFDVLVFGSGSSLTIWGRYAAWLGRSASAIVPSLGLQIYVDDPAMTLKGTWSQAARDLTRPTFSSGVKSAASAHTMGWRHHPGRRRQRECHRHNPQRQGREVTENNKRVSVEAGGGTEATQVLHWQPVICGGAYPSSTSVPLKLVGGAYCKWEDNG